MRNEVKSTPLVGFLGKIGFLFKNNGMRKMGGKNQWGKWGKWGTSQFLKNSFLFFLARFSIYTTYPTGFTLKVCL